MSTTNNHSPSSPRPAARPGRAQPALAGSPSTLPLSHLAPQCHRVTRDATGSQLEIPIFARDKAVTTHIGSCTCQTEGKGVRTITMQYRPSGRAEDHGAGPVGAPGACPPQTQPQASNIIRHAHRRLRYYVRHRMVLAYVFVDIDVRYRIIPT